MGDKHGAVLEFAMAEFIHMPRTMKLCNGDVPLHTHTHRCITVKSLYIAGGR